MTELIVPLDVPDAPAAQRLVDVLGDSIDFYKVGLELFSAAGPEVVTRLRAQHKRVFLDLKLHDIPQTVGRAVQAAGRLDVALLTLHAAGGRRMLEAARDAAAAFGPDRPRLLAVTVLTSLDASDLAETGIAQNPDVQVQTLSRLALGAGVDGIVCSPMEAADRRRDLGPHALIVTPGIRPAEAAHNDQKRVATPEAAVRAGATHLVVGRPITAAANPREAALAIRHSIRAAASPSIHR